MPSYLDPLLDASIEYDMAGKALDVWVDAVLIGRQGGDGSTTDRLEVILAVVHLMVVKGVLPADGQASGLMAVALDRLADQKSAAGHVPPA